MNQSVNIRAFAVFGIGILLAIWLGVSIVTDQMDTLLKFGAAGLLLFCSLLGRRIWLIIPVMSALAIPLVRNYSTDELGQCLFLGFAILMFLMRRFPGRFSMGELEWWRLILAACIIQVYMRNPVGLGLFGAGTVGGKTYFLTALAFLVSIFYGALIVPIREIKWAMYINFFVGLCAMPIGEIRTRSGLAEMEATQGSTQTAMADEGAATRVGFLGGLGIRLSQWVASFVNPLKVCFHPLWGPLILISLAAAAGSGFRNSIAIVGFPYLLSIAYRGGFPSVLIASIIGVFGIATLSLINMVSPLPPNAQRALTVFPGTWEKRYKDDAKSSSEWRYEMWREALFTDNWIANKWVGDGLGMSAKELERSQNLTDSRQTVGRTGISIHQENAMLAGDYHSGPVQTIRTVGYLGLAVLLAAMIRLAIHAHRQILRCRGTEWFPLALFMCMGKISAPFIFIFVFGDFGKAAIGVFLGAAGVRLLQNNLPLPPYVIPKREPYVLITARNRSAMMKS